MKSKATHQGHCQLCGRFQMLPNGKLAKHGYTVEFNFFNGVCPGSHNLPYELSCDLLPAQRDAAKETAKRMTKFAAETRALRDPKAVWIHEYKKSERYGYSGTYVWRQVEINFIWTKFSDGEGEYLTVNYIGLDGKTQDAKPHDSFAKTREGQIELVYVSLNGAKAKEVLAVAKQHADYAVWAQNRIDGWKLAELTPIAADARQAVVHLSHPKYAGRVLCTTRQMYSAGTSDQSKVTCTRCRKGITEGWWGIVAKEAA